MGTLMCFQGKKKSCNIALYIKQKTKKETYTHIDNLKAKRFFYLYNFNSRCDYNFTYLVIKTIAL